MRNTFRDNGFTLLEVLIAFMILSFGLLGAVALQAKAKQASFDSLQRAAAVELASDILHRMRNNDANNVVALYDVDFSSDDAVSVMTDCYGGFCSAAQVAQTDINNWQHAIRARERSGSLDNATVCINPTTSTNGVNVEVIVTWRGRQEMTAADDNPAGSCGVNDDRRRAVVMETFLLLRGQP